MQSVVVAIVENYTIMFDKTIRMTFDGYETNFPFTYTPRVLPRINSNHFPLPYYSFVRSIIPLVYNRAGRSRNVIPMEALIMKRLKFSLLILLQILIIIAAAFMCINMIQEASTGPKKDGKFMSQYIVYTI